jgi:YggT family protein
LSVKLAWAAPRAYICTEANPEGPPAMMSMNPFLWLILTIINIYFWIILAMVILSWLVAFNVVNRSNPYVRQIGYALERLTEPLLRPIRRFLPDLGGIDLSPIVLLIAMQFFGMLVTWLFVRLGIA